MSTEFKNLTDEDLTKLIVKTETEIKIIESENILLERYLLRNLVDIRYRPEQKISTKINKRQKNELIENIITEDYDFIKTKIKELKIETSEEIKRILNSLEIIQNQNLKDENNEETKQNLIKEINGISMEALRKHKQILKERGIQIKLDKSDDETYLVNPAEEKTQQLIGLKRATGETALSLASETKILQTKSKNLSNLKQKAIENDLNTKKFIKKEEIIEKEVKILNEKIKELQKQIEIYKAPNALEYARLKNKLLSLEKDVKSLNRCKYISSLKLKNLRMKFNKKV